MKLIIRIIVFGIGGYLSLLSAHAQTPKADSLKAILETSASDSLWFETAYELSVELSELPGQMSGLEWARKIFSVAEHKNDIANMAWAEIAIGKYYHLRNQTDSALYHFFNAHTLAASAGDEGTIASVYCDLGSVYIVSGELQQAISNSIEGLSMAAADSACLYGHIATAYISLGEFDSASQYFVKVLELNERQPNPSARTMSTSYNNLGAVYFYRGDYHQAIEYYNKSKQIDLDNDFSDSLPIDLINIGEANTYLGNFSEAEEYLTQGLRLATQNKDRYVVSSALLMLSDLYERQGEYKTGFDYYKSYVALKDSLFSVEKTMQMAEMQALYETEKKERHILKLQKEKQEDTAEIERQRLQNMLFGGSALLFLLLSGALVFGYTHLKKAKAEVDHRNALITDINRRLNASQDALMLSNKTKDKFFALIAHDLRGPVTSLAGIGKLLHFNLKKGRTAKVEELIGQIDGSAVKVNHLLDNLLKWALSQTGALNYRPESVHLQRIVEDCRTAFFDIAKAKEIEVRIEVDDDTWVLADYNMLSTVLRNLISNALKFTPAGGVVLLKAEKGKEGVNFSVEDTGIGMPPEQIKKVNGKEQLTSTPGTDGETGTGLGLVLCREFVQLHGSQLSIRSNSKGSVFSFVLGAANVNTAKAAARAKV